MRLFVYLIFVAFVIFNLTVNTSIVATSTSDISSIDISKGKQLFGTRPNRKIQLVNMTTMMVMTIMTIMMATMTELPRKF